MMALLSIVEVACGKPQKVHLFETFLSPGAVALCYAEATGTSAAIAAQESGSRKLVF